MSLEDRNSNSPLSIKDLEMIEAANLSSIDKHHLRLLAHCLETFRLIANGTFKGSLPKKESVVQWFQNTYSLQDDQTFFLVLMEQFDVAGMQLEKMAAQNNISPLEMTISDLIRSIQTTVKPI